MNKNYIKNTHQYIAISPSGKYYGSEQVLFDYLSETDLKFEIYIPMQGVFKEILLNTVFHHKLIFFNNSRLWTFYLLIFFKLLFKKYSAVYCNEGGHLRYIRLLSSLFYKKKFYIHVRINEDTASERWVLPVPENLTIITISKFIQSKLNFTSIMLYDPYPFRNKISGTVHPVSPIKVGIIGRISYSKGIIHLVNLLTYIKQTKTDNILFYLFGEADENIIKDDFFKILVNIKEVKLMGFFNEKPLIYQNIDCVLHFCHTEPLGRVFFEAIDYEIPFIGIDNGGIGEIAAITKLSDLLISKDSENISKDILEKLKLVQYHKHDFIEKIRIQKNTANEIFSLKKYCKQLDFILSDKNSF